MGWGENGAGIWRVFVLVVEMLGLDRVSRSSLGGIRLGQEICSYWDQQPNRYFRPGLQKWRRRHTVISLEAPWAHPCI